MPRWNTVAIVGVGLIGGSIGLALRQRKLADSVVGIGRSGPRLQQARRLGALDATSTRLERGVRDADLVVVCTPVEQIADDVAAAADAAPEALITDVGSTKATILAQLAEALPRSARFVGSHPLAGSEKAGVAHARADLFVDRTVVLTPSSDTNPKDLAETKRLWESLGSKVVLCSAEQHDRALAATSHLPHLVASALASATPEDALALAAGGWKDTTRVAAGDPELWQQILSDNRQHVLRSLDRFASVLQSFRTAIDKQNDRKLRQLLAAGKRHRDSVGS